MTTPSKPTRGIGPVPEDLKNENLENFLMQVRKLLLEIQAGRVAALSGSGSGAGGAPSPAPTPGPPGPPGPPAPAPYVPDLTPPPTPSGVVVVGGPDWIGISTDAPTFLVGHGYARTLVYGARYSGTGPLPTFSAAVKVHEFVGEVGTFNADFNEQWHVWLKWLTVDGVESVSPSGGANGDVATTGQDVVGLLEILTGQITESQLFATLGARVDLIDGPSSLAGSVAARILAEANARGVAISNEAVIRQNADDALASSITTLTASTPANAELTPRLFYGFDAGLDGWAALNGTATASSGLVTWTPTAANPTFQRALTGGDTFQGAENTGIRAKVRRVSGTGAWEGNAYYSTAGHGNSNSFRKTIDAPANPDVWNILEWNMSTLTAGGSDWVDSEVTGLRIDLVGDTGSVWQFDWVTVGSLAVSPTLAALQIEQAVRASADDAEALSRETLAVQMRGSYTGTDANLVSTGLIFSERSARVTADEATAQVITGVQSRIGSETGMATVAAWDFAAGADGWTGGLATVTAPGNGYLTWVPTSVNAALNRTLATPERFLGADRELIRARVRRNGGTGTWEGRLFYSTAGHGNSGSYTKVIAAPTDPDKWTVLEWDMSALTTGGTDWMTSTITGLRLDLVSDVGSSWEFDWISSGSKTTTPISAAVLQEISTRATETGYLGAQWTVRMTVGNIAGGFGLSGSSSPGATPTIDFGIRANRFFIAPPEGVSGVGNIIPFAVQTVPVTTPSGEVLPAGVYIDALFVRNIDAALGRFSNAFITNAMIVNLSATKITAGSLSVGNYIQSSNYVGGTQGWRIDGGGGFEVRNAANNRIFHLGASGASPVLQVGTALQILANGTATFAGTVNASAGNFTGNVFAATGTIGGAIIDSNGVRSSNYVAGVAGWRLHNDGTAEFDAATVRGNVTADTLNAASGTIGTITAGLLRDAANQTRINLNATGSQDFLRAGGGLVRITADGKAYFTAILASGTYTFAGAQLVGVSEAVIYIDTGLNMDLGTFNDQSLSARVGEMRAATSFSPGAGTYIGTVFAQPSVAIGAPFFDGIGGETPGQNPYGASQQRIFIRVVARLTGASGLMTSFALNYIEWTLDSIG